MTGRKPSRRAVLCLRCGSPSVVNDWHRVAEEFSVCCRHCDRRAIYRASDLRAIDGAEPADARSAQRRGFALFGAR